MKAEIQALANRVEKLEKHNRALKRVTTLVLGLILAMVLMGQAGTPDDLIEAKMVMINDEKGRPRIVLGVVDERAGLVLFDDNMTGRASLNLEHDGRPALRLYSKDGKLRAELGMSPDDLPMLGFRFQSPDETGMEEDEEGSTSIPEASLSLTEDGSTILRLSSKNEQQQFMIVVKRDLSLLSVGGGPHKAGVRLGTHANNGPSIRLQDSDGNWRALMGSMARRNRSTGEVENLPLSSLTLMDRDGTVIWSAP